MGSCPSGEDLILKARKPYTITKPRERWTEEEHNRFLEAVKLYGRAWQRIEEHIGTKSAVQIRSHAQKFFTKLEKEALGKGVPVGQAHDIDIPPPRPKRKPANPYPIKTSLGAPTSSLVGTKDGNLVTSFSSLNLQNELPLGEPHRAGKLQKPKKIKDKGTYVEVLNLFQEASGASISSARKTTVLMPTALTNTHTFREFIPPSKETNDCTANDESSLTEQSKGNHNLCEVQCPHAKVVQQDITTNKANHTEKCEPLLLNETEVTPYFPRDVPGQAVDGSTGTYIQTPTANMTVPTSKVQSSGGHGNFNCLSHLKQQANSPTPCSHQPFPVFNSLFTPFSNNQDVYKSFMNIPSALSSLIISTLIKNPAAYSAARLAASSWPCVDDYSADTLVGGFPARHMNPSPSLAVITAATVAAATAWWTSHGLLPYCPPFHPRFTFTHAPIIFPTMTPEAPKDTEERMEDVPRNHAWVDLRLLNPEQSKAVEMQSPASESPASSSSNSEESRGTRSHSSSSKVSGNEQKQVACSELNDPKGKTRKQLDRSSCGSNTPSGSEVETETLEKHGKSKELFNEAQLSHPSSEPVGSTGNVNDSWKEVSDEGWLAFQALFSREILPQSFPGHDSKNKMHPNNANEEGKQKSKKDTDTSLELELSSKAWSMSLDHPQLVKMEGSLRSDNNLNGIPSNRLVGHGKLNAHRMGFKPYKRCSMEAKESRAVKGSDQSEENRAKRICLKGDAST